MSTRFTTDCGKNCRTRRTAGDAFECSVRFSLMHSDGPSSSASDLIEDDISIGTSETIKKAVRTGAIAPPSRPPNAATLLAVPRIERKWAGLRSFLPDHLPAVGYDEGIDGFFWLIGQGGFGMQTSAAMGRLAAALLDEAPVPDDLAEWGVDAHALSPARLRM